MTEDTEKIVSEGVQPKEGRKRKGYAGIRMAAFLAIFLVLFVGVNYFFQPV